MEVEEVNSDLRSLRNLYSLLQCAPENFRPITLDLQARIMLKDLLDHATKRLLESHSKIISAQSISLSKSSADSPEKIEAMTETRPSPSPNLQNASSTMIQAASKASLLQKLFQNVHLFLLFYVPILTLLRFFRKPFTVSAKVKEQTLAQRVANTTAANRKLESTNKLCQTCGKRSMKRTNSIAERTVPVEKIDNPVRDSDDQSTLVHFQGLVQPVKSFRRLASSSSQTLTNQVEHFSHEDVDEISREASHKINQIDSCLIGPVTDRFSPKFQTINHRQSQAENSVQIMNPTINQQVDYKLLHGSRLANAVPSWRHVSQSNRMESQEIYHKDRKLLSHQSSRNRRESSKKADRILSRIPSQRLSQDPGTRFSSMVENTNVASHSKSYDPGLSRLAYRRESVKHSKDQITRAWDERASIGKTSKPSLPPRISLDTKCKAVDSSYELDRSRTSRYDHQEENPRFPFIIRPTLLDRSSSRIKESRRHEPLRSAKFRNFSEESAGSSTRSSSSSSSWTTQQSNGSCTGSEGQSFRRTSRQRTHKNITSGSVQCSEDEPAASISTSYNSSYTSEQASSSRSEDEGQSLLRSSANESGLRSNSSFDTAYSKDIKLQHRVGSKRKLVRRKSPINPIGRFRRIKNKLGLIFHHHHHHHHHHHNDNKVHHQSSQQKDEGKKLYRTSNNNVARKDGRSRGSIVPSKRQEGNFRALVVGLMRHIRQTKTSKKPGNTIGQLGKDRHRHQKKPAKKLNYWQALRQSRGVKLPQKNRVKIRYPGPKSQL